jgi:diaminopimelate decarboxylase
MAEPGRHFSSKTFYLLTRIIGKRIKSGMPCYHLNESVYHNFNCTIMDDVNFDGSTDQFYGKIENQTNIISN